MVPLSDAQERSEGNPRIFQLLGPEETCPYSYSHSLFSWKSATYIFFVNDVCNKGLKRFRLSLNFLYHEDFPRTPDPPAFDSH